jgi:hypothetical protein
MYDQHDNSLSCARQVIRQRHQLRPLSLGDVEAKLRLLRGSDLLLQSRYLSQPLIPSALEPVATMRFSGSTLSY